MPLPTLHISLGRSGWLLGDPIKSILGTSTYLGFASFDELTAPRRVTIRRGRSHELDRIEAGRCVIRLPNRTGDFDPTNISSPFYPDIKPMTPVRVWGTWSAVDYDLFNGFTEAWPMAWTRGPSGDSVVELRCVDAFKVLALAQVSLTRPQETTGARIGAILDAISWPSTRSVDTGDSTMQAATISGTALELIQSAEQTEAGIFFIAADGTTTFYSRTHAFALDETNDVWGDSGTEKSYEDLVTSYDDDQLWNEIVVTAPSLADQVARDEASIGSFGGLSGAARTLTAATQLTTTGAMLDRAELLLARYSQPKLRVNQLTLEPRADSGQWARVLLRDLHERIAARKRPPHGGLIDQPSSIEGITHDITLERWKVGWNLTPSAYTEGIWELGVVGKSELGMTTTIVSG